MKGLRKMSKVAISFDIDITKIRIYWDGVEDIPKVMKSLGFIFRHNNMYVSENSENPITLVYKAIHELSKIDWFKNAVRDIRAFRVDDWSDFTSILKGSNVN